MTSADARPFVGSSDHVRRAVMRAWLLWAALFVAVAGYVFSGSSKTVTFVYRAAAERWLRGEPLYSSSGWDFLYPPQSAIVFAPLALLPQVPGDVLWRLLAILTFGFGVRQYARLASRDSDPRHFLLMTCLTIPVAFDAARNGQATLPCAGLMMMAVVAMARSRWWRATLWLMLGLAVKPLALFLVVIAAVAYAPMRGRIAAGLAALLLLPFAFQAPQYVLDQYRQWAVTSPHVGQVGAEGAFAQIFALSGAAGLPTSPSVQAGLSAVAAVLAVGLAVRVRRRWPPDQAGVLLFAIAVGYLMLFSLRTENNTYAALAPAIGAFAAQAWYDDRRPATAAGLGILAMGIAGGYELGRRLAPQLPPVWLAPLMAVCFVAFVLHRVAAGPLPRRPADQALPEAAT